MGVFNDFRWLAKFGPVFGVHGKNIQILNEPAQFYKTLNDLALSSRKRIVLSALYLGTGTLEQSFVQSIRQAISKQSRSFRLHVLLDCTRGSRGGDVSSRTMLTPLVEEFGPRVRVALYHSPKLRGLLRLILPHKWNEIIGLMHIKAYVFDDTVVLSGANLSVQYFEKRQDRYFVFKDSPQLADYYASLIETVGRFSFQLDATNRLWPENAADFHPYKTSLRNYVSNCRKLLAGFIRPNDTLETVLPYDTYVFPLIQMGQFQFGNDYAVTRKLLENCPNESSVKLSTGYFNLVPRYENLITDGQATYDVLTAHPKANSFYKAPGAMFHIPAMYTLLLKQFFDKAESARARTNILEYERDGWTFHAKGLWYSAPGEDKPSLTMIGSPNFGFRSVDRDLESQVVVVTENEELRNRLREEQRALFKRATKVTRKTFEDPERSIPAWLHVVTKMFRNFL